MDIQSIHLEYIMFYFLKNLFHKIKFNIVLILVPKHSRVQVP